MSGTAPTPAAAPPQPKGLGNLKTLKTMHRNWVTAGGTSIYGPVTQPPRQPGSSATLNSASFIPADQTTLLNTLKALTNASFAITVDGTLRQVTPMNLTAATSLPVIATAISNNLTGATCVWSTDHFVIQSSSVGGTSRLTYASAPASGTDISVTCRLTQATGAVLSQGVAPSVAAAAA